MTIRANSLRSVLVDGGFFVAAMAIVALAATYANSQDAATGTPADAAPSAADLEVVDGALEAESDVAIDQSLILGMKVEADQRGRAIVQEVSAASPAWDAGVREGDEIVEFHSLKPGEMEYMKWDRDLRRMIRNTQDGQAVPIEISRDGEQISLRVKLPESRAAAVRDARQEERALAKLAQSQQQMQVPQGQAQDRIAEYGGYPPQAATYGPGWGGGGVGVIADDGTVAANGQNNRAASNAVAELFATDTIGQSNVGAQPTNAPGQAAGQGGQGGRVGMAVFQNSQHGVSAHVEVTGLPQGRYRVGVGDGSGTGFVNPFDDPRAGQMPTDDASLQDGRRPGIDDGRQVPGQERRQQTPQSPAGAPVGGAPGRSSSLAAPGGDAYLAQQFDAQSGQTGNADSAAGTAAGNQNVNPNAPRRNAAGNQQHLQGGSMPQDRRAEDVMTGHGMGGNMPGFLMEIGMLEVGVHGAGQVQTQLEGVTVQNLAGMSVMVVPAVPRGSGGMDATGGAQHRPGQGQAAVSANAGRTQNQAAAGSSGDANNPLGDHGMGPVAMGTIRVVEGSGLPRQTNDAWEQGLQESAEDNQRQRDALERRNPISSPDPILDPNRPQR